VNHGWPVVLLLLLGELGLLIFVMAVAALWLAALRLLPLLRWLRRRRRAPLRGPGGLPPGQRRPAAVAPRSSAARWAGPLEVAAATLASGRRSSRRSS
jgi:hypothetical protein